MRQSAVTASLGLVTVLCFGQSHVATTSLSTALAGRTIEANGLPATEITISHYQTKPGENLGAVLVGNGFVPNGDAISIVQDLNPGVTATAPLPAGTLLNMPAVPTNNAQRMTFLQVDRQEKQKIFTFAAAIQADVNKSPNSTFLKPVSDQLVLVADAAWHKSASKQMLNQINIESDILSTLSTKHIITDADKERIKLIHENLQAQKTALDENSPDAIVEIKTVRSNGRDAQPYTICYSPEYVYISDNKCQDTFPRLSTPSAQNIVGIATYMIWAVTPGTTTRVSEVKKVPVLKANVSDELVVNQ